VFLGTVLTMGYTPGHTLSHTTGRLVNE